MQTTPGIEDKPGPAHNYATRGAFFEFAAAASEPPDTKKSVPAQGANLFEDTSMTLTASLTLCQYCEHANPADAKFCTGCGAPLHLIPCPQCGAVNQKTSKTCYQCHGELRESTEILLASAPATASEEAAGNADSTAMLASPYASPPPTPQRQPLFVVAIIFVAFAAAAYFAYQQRSPVDVQKTTETATRPENPPTSSKTTEPSATNASVGIINTAPPAMKPAAAPTPVPEVLVEKPASLPSVEPGEAGSQLQRQSTGTPRNRTSRRNTPTETVISAESSATANGARTVPSAASGIEKPSPRTGPCTEAIAALGLCTSGPTKGNP